MKPSTGKFIQITATTCQHGDGRFNYVFAVVFALDEDGNVWEFTGHPDIPENERTWCKVTNKRKEADEQ